jgi:hypothetical protein
MSFATAARNRVQQTELRRLVTQEPGFEEDVLGIALGVRELIQSQKAAPVPLATIQRDIMEIITLKRLGVRIITKKVTPKVPAEWTEEEEDLFFHWIHDTFTEDLWNFEVMAPVFREDVRPWEIEGWRSSLQIYLDQWIVRSMELITQIYPPEEEEEEDAEFNTHAFTGKSRNYN